MTVRQLRWGPESYEAMKGLPSHLQARVRDRLVALATGPIPPEDAIPDLDVPGGYQIVTSEYTLICGMHDDEVWIWLLRPNT
ncbi:type II toxin-antitoxin system RelE family toxin [Nonomuraea sp. SYSU D8015]|uniref:type II toxin-antitoxin system RelE family toxin n=1 Tax=Nonomuraea sp. SYSU D8015 TaxID=2593644 RepID=UPI001660B2B2|nr:hypothetical protein [Nonomuraea sp. SYSU D8015]